MLRLDKLKKAVSESQKGSGSASKKKSHNNFWLVPQYLDKNAKPQSKIILPTDMKITRMEDKEYRARPEVSNSDLGLIAKWRTGLDQKPSTSKSANFQVGSAYHAGILEPEKLEGLLSKLDGENKEKVKFLIETAKSDAELLELINRKSALKEVCIFFTEPITGIKCKLKADLLIPNSLTLDLKSTSSKTEKSFLNSCKTFGYFRQLAFYFLGTQTPELILFATSKHKNRGNFWIKKSPTDPEILKGYSEAIHLLELSHEWRWSQKKQKLKN